MGLFDFLRHKTDDEIEAEELKKRTNKATSNNSYSNADISEEMKQDVKAILIQGHKINGVKHLVDNAQMNIKEAKDYVEHLIATDKDLNSLPQYAPEPARCSLNDLDPSIVEEARKLVLNGEKIQAIKVVKDASDAGLKEAKEFVEKLC